MNSDYRTVMFSQLMIIYILELNYNIFYHFCLQDILNNLESCDLEDDDLMLDVDLPEDAPLENGKWGHIEPPEAHS